MAFFSKADSRLWRGAAIIMVVASHYVQWCAGQLGHEELQYAVSRMGVYGVVIFLLLSGYGLVKSTRGKRLSWHFIGRRMRNMYVPYLLIAGFIEWYAGSMTAARDWLQYFLGVEYWFIHNIFVFYLAFFAIWKWGKGKETVRVVVLFLFVALYSWYLYRIGRADFWYVSNLSFVAGVCLAVYEKQLLSLTLRGYGARVIFLCLCMGAAAVSGMRARLVPMEMPWKDLSHIGAALLWAALVTSLNRCLTEQGSWKRGGWLRRLLEFLGEQSLYLYLLHTFLFYQILNRLSAPFPIQLAVMLAGTVLTATAVNGLLELFWKYLQRVEERRKRKE